MVKHGEIGTTPLGAEMTPEEITAKISIGTESTEDQITMRLTGLIEVLLGEKISINAELVIKATDMLMSKMMPEVIWCRSELIVLGLIEKIRLVPRWQQD